MSSIPENMFVSDKIPVLEPILTVYYFWKYNPCTQRLCVSESLSTYLGYSANRTEFSLERFRDHIHQKDHPLFDDAWNTMVQTGTLHTVLRVQKQDGSFNNLLFKGERLGGHDEDVTGICRDLTQLHKAGETLSGLHPSTKNIKQLERSRNLEALGTLAGGIAHNFNNILMSILGFTEMSQHELPKEHVCQDYLSKVLASGQQGKELVKQILIYSGKANHDKHPLQIGIIIKEITKSFQTISPENIRVTIAVDDKKQLIHAEPTQPYQILTNLLDNAVEALDTRPGTIEIRLETRDFDPSDKDLPADLEPGEFLVLKVKDTGSGMAPKTLDRVFEPFFIAGSHSQTKMGMGLPIVYGIVQDLHGNISIESEPGQGTTVTIFLPTMKIEPNHEQRGPASLYKHGHVRILFIDDQPEIVSWAKTSLTHLGYEITTTTDSVKGLGWIEKDPKQFDLIITDLIMPSLNGREIAHKIHKLNPDLPIVICTGLHKDKAIEKMRGLKVTAILEKPFSMAEFSRVIPRALQQH